jgi:hypothetical protein
VKGIRAERGGTDAAYRDGMADALDVDAMIQRFRDRAAAVRERPLPPVAGPQREAFVAQAEADHLDFALIGDATWDFTDGVLTLRIDLSS